MLNLHPKQYQPMEQKNQNPTLIAFPTKEIAETFLNDCVNDCLGLPKHDGVEHFLFALTNIENKWMVSICDTTKTIDNYQFVCPECLKGAHTHSSN